MMTRACVAVALVVALGGVADGGEVGLAPGRLRTEYRSAPLGIDERRPRLSWILEGDPAERGLTQRAYQVLAASRAELLVDGKADLWDSGRVDSDQTVHVEWAGKALRSSQRVHWTVRVWDSRGRRSTLAAPTWFETALLSPSDWRAVWIDDHPDRAPRAADLWTPPPAPLFRKEFRVDRPVARARVHVSGLGYHELSINGRRVGDHRLDPGWTSYARRVLYATHDVTALLQPGENAIGAMVGNGWYQPGGLTLFGRFVLREQLATGSPRLLVQLHIEYQDGTSERVVTDRSWKVGDSALLRNNVFLGELYDARREQPGWDRPGFDDRRWRRARLARGALGPLRAQDQPPIRVTRTLKPVSVAQPRPGMFVFDLGQNFAGWVTLRARGPAGTRVALRFSELLYPDGTPNGMTTFAGQIKTWTDADRVAHPPESATPPTTAWQQDVYVMKGDGVETYTPRFTFHGFRYVTIEGYPGTPTLGDLVGHRLTADVEAVSSFASSSPLWNRLHEVVQWTLLSNLFSVQSDCPHRERLGYGGDIVATSEMAILNYDMARFYAKVARDFADAARPSGGLTETAPYVGIADKGLGDGTGPVGWGVAHPVLLRDLYTYYGDRRLLEEQWEPLRRYVDFLRGKARDDLLDADISDHESLSEKSPAVTATALYHHAARIAADVARTLGRREDAARYGALADRVQRSFNRAFLDLRTGRYERATQTTQAFALGLGLVPEVARPRALAALLADVERHAGHLTTGIFATKYLLDALSEHGHAHVAARIAGQRSFPSWGYMLDHGATTLWETWKRDEGLYSHNHPMFGSVDEWLMKWIAGIAPDPRAVAFDRVLIRPSPVGGLTWARGRYDSVRGPVETAWKIEGSTFVLDLALPPGTVATVHLPARRGALLREGKTAVSQASGVRVLAIEDRRAVLEVRSGRYRFASALPR